MSCQTLSGAHQTSYLITKDDGETVLNTQASLGEVPVIVAGMVPLNGGKEGAKSTGVTGITGMTETGHSQRWSSECSRIQARLAGTARTKPQLRAQTPKRAGGKVRP